MNTPVTDRRSADGVVVLGMGRGGTSAVAGMFAECGFLAGRGEDVLPPTAFNERGHFENRGVMETNERLLEEMDASWFDPPSQEVQEEHRRRAAGLVLGEVDRMVCQAGDGPIVVKDPRVGVMLPIWCEVLRGRLHPVLVVRDPIEIAQSIRRRDGTPPPFGLAMWELHLRLVLGYLNGRCVTVAPYERLLHEPAVAEAVVLAATRHIAPARAATVQPHRAPAALDQHLRHGRAAGQHAERLTVRQLELWRYLDALTPGDAVLEVAADLLDIPDACREGARLETERRALVAQRDALRGEAAQLAERLQTTAARTEALSASLAAQQADADAAKAAADAAKAAADAAKAAADAAMADHTAYIDLLTARLASVESSRSWRLTAPLRRARARARISR